MYKHDWRMPRNSREPLGFVVVPVATISLHKTCDHHDREEEARTVIKNMHTQMLRKYSRPAETRIKLFISAFTQQVTVLPPSRSVWSPRCPYCSFICMSFLGHHHLWYQHQQARVSFGWQYTGPDDFSEPNLCCLPRGWPSFVLYVLSIHTWWRCPARLLLCMHKDSSV